MRRLMFAAAIAATVSLHAGAQTTATRTRAHVETLASERLEGRLAGSKGEELAGSYIASQLERIGANPLPGRSGYLQPFDFTAGTKDGGSTISVSYERPTAGSGTGPRVDGQPVRALSFSDNGDAKATVVFAGYGLVVPDGQDFSYDSYTGLDVKDKIVLVLRYFPEDADQKTRGVFARYQDLRFKAMAARQRGAKAMLVVTGPRSPNAGELAPMTFDTALAGSGIVAASIIGQVADAMFSASGKTLSDVQKALDSGNPHVAGFAMPEVTVSVRTVVQREKQTGHNVLAYLPASAGILRDIDLGAPSDRRVDKPWLIIGAHYDHLGRGDHGNTLAGKDEIGHIHFGADDNASGTAAVLAIGEALSSQPRRRNVMLALWSGEEEGLLGSSAFIASAPIPADQVEAYLNFDMVGRMQDNKLTIQAAGTSPAWAKIIEQTNIVAGFDLAIQQDPYQPTDVASFNLASIPCLTFFTGAHADYHKPSDTADKIDYPDLDRVVEFAAAIARKLMDLDQAPSFTKVDLPAQGGTGRAGMRLFTGTIPDYSTEVKGLLLGGVIGGGPAEQAGLQKGDIIVEIAGQTITNIYDYMYAMDLLKIGQPAKLVYMRNGQRKETTLTPSARK